jgi:regulator of protease activity HflC (stomatin/prohibitin superfamily)
MTHKKPEDLFRAEKERARGSANSQHARLLAEAKAAFDKLMAEGQAARKSGRPRKHPLPPLKTTPSTRVPPKPPAAYSLEPTLRLPTISPSKPPTADTKADKKADKKASKPAPKPKAKKAKAAKKRL